MYILVKGEFMLIKYLLCLSLLNIFSFNHIKVNNLYNYKNSPYSISDWRIDGRSDLFKINNFSFGYIGQKEEQKLDFSYILKNPNYTYEVEILYSFLDEDDIHGYENYHPSFSFSSGEYFDASFVLKRINIPKDITSFNFYIRAFEINESNIVLKTISEQNISFNLVNYNAEIRANSTITKVPYYVEFNSSKCRLYSYFDEINFYNYLSVAYQEIYFRIKPKEFKFSYRGNLGLTYVELIISNDNGSFSDCTSYNSPYGKSFLLDIAQFDKKKFYLEYKNIKRGGKNNLYLDPFTLKMYKDKKTKFYEVENIYLPKDKKSIFEELKVIMVFRNFGSNSVDVLIPFTIRFEKNYINDYFYCQERIKNTLNDSTLEDINP